MMRFYSKEKKGFYDSGIHRTLPVDAVEISLADHAGLMSAQEAGKIIDWTGEKPVAVDYVAPPLTDEQIDDQGKRDGFMYGQVQVPVTNMDAIGAMQIKMGFEDFGMTGVNFHLSNGVILPLTLAEWPAFSVQFFTARASFF